MQPSWAVYKSKASLEALVHPNNARLRGSVTFEARRRVMQFVKVAQDTRVANSDICFLTGHHFCPHSLASIFLFKPQTATGNYLCINCPIRTGF